MNYDIFVYNKNNIWSSCFFLGRGGHRAAKTLEGLPSAENDTGAFVVFDEMTLDLRMGEAKIEFNQWG